MVMRKLHVLTAAGVAALGFAAVAHAQTAPPYPTTPVPAGSDALCVTDNTNACVRGTPLVIPQAGEKPSYRTTIPTNAAIGTIVEVDDFDTAGQEGGNPTPSPSDYIYSCADPNGKAVICVNTDTENLLPVVPNGNIVKTLLENGKWQNLDQWLPVAAPNEFLWGFSDVPEPAAWGMMLVGFGRTGALPRRSRVTASLV